ncbi:hypothetical protein [Halorarum halobium]|uniref:hypothetical protein n=1 Tax=Halorarum halobium TaxID=3075121 RepID=UPI0028AEC5D6|nr:hypothetical protein [Halobaculum sp. XH14]
MTDTTRNQDPSDGTLARLLGGSRVAATLRGPFREGSRTRRAADRLSATVRNAFLYRWLTKEPEPEVVVIDLRETWTVGPAIRVLDWAVERTLPYWRESTLRRWLDRLVELGERAADTRYGGLVVRLLEPPEPPAEEGDSEASESGRGAAERDHGAADGESGAADDPEPVGSGDPAGPDERHD